MEPLLNRWRGTGKIIWNLSGSTIFAIYIFTVICIYTVMTSTMLPFTTIVINGTDTTYTFHNNQIFSTIILSILASGLYILGESFGWGKWVGYVTGDRNEVQYDNKTGRSFPYIHFISNFFIDQTKDYLNYCRLALVLRGAVYWTPLLTLVYLIDGISFNGYIAGILLTSLGFTIASELSRYVGITYQSRFLNLSRGWENQEVIYGFFQFLAFTLNIVLHHYSY